MRHAESRIPRARETAVTTVDGAPAITSGRSRLALESYWRRISSAEAPGSAPRTSYQVIPGPIAPPESGSGTTRVIPGLMLPAPNGACKRRLMVIHAANGLLVNHIARWLRDDEANTTESSMGVNMR